MRTLHLGLRVADLGRSVAFYTSVGYEVVGEVPETDLGHLTMLRLPGDEFVTIEFAMQRTRYTRTCLRFHLIFALDGLTGTTPLAKVWMPSSFRSSCRGRS